MPHIHADLRFAGKRIRNLVAAVAGDEPLRKAEAGAPGVGGSAEGFTGASWVKRSGAILLPVNNVPWYSKIARTITGVSILTLGGSGSCVVDIWKRPVGTYPPVVGDSICASAKPTISGGVTYTDVALTGWTTAIAAGDTLLFHLESNSIFTFVGVQLQFSE